VALQDEVGHGTHVAGTIGGTGAGAMTYSEEELAGIAPDVEIVSLKIASAGNGVFDDVGFEENALFAIDYLIRHPELGVTVTNNSWGLLPTEPETVPIEDTDYDAANEMVQAAAAAGITMVFSAGNDGPEPGTIRPGPGAQDAILVAAACKSVDTTDEACLAGDVITSFSSRGNADGTGPQVDITAPGDTIMAPLSPSVLVPLSYCPERYADEQLYYCLSGTSMASPHVAGVVALMQQANPDLTPAEAERCLVDTADDMLDPGFDIHSGHGMVDTPAAVACAAGIEPSSGTAPDPAPTPAPAPDPVEDSSTPLPTTGGGLAALGLLGLAVRTGSLRTRP
jgi:serine protease AprX